MPRILVAFMFFISVLIAANSPADSALTTCHPDSGVKMGSVHSPNLQCVDLQNCCSQSCASDSPISLNSIATAPVCAPKKINSAYSFSLVAGFDDVVKRPPKSVFICA
ncbi:MAG: hypothetical protein OFPII_01480 [Osedax symbiont Rs1]|nr:MAG: hypothetical protein OFPII_01480 [Osedax symbiont Rs1]